MTAREQRRRRRELRAMRRRVAGMIVLLSILAVLVLYAASHTWTGIEKGTDPAETDPLPLATSRRPSPGTPVSKSATRTFTPSLASPITRRGASRSRDRSPLSRSRSIGACPTTSRIRSRRSYFRSTVQKYGDVWQFSPAPYLYTAEPTETQYEAVYTALAAEEPILPLDTVYFSTSPYNDSIVAVIGNHYFCSIF